MSSFRSRSPPLCFERVGSPSETALVTDLGAPSSSNFDFNPCWSSSPSLKFDRNPVLHNNIKQIPNKETKKVVTSKIVEGGAGGLMTTLSSEVKRLSTTELEQIIQRQLGKVIDGHRYNTWLRKQVDETDAQMTKYKNRIEALQKHVNDLTTVIQKHMQNSEDSPPMKLTRNVGLQVRIKEKGIEPSQPKCQASSPANIALLINSEQLTTTQDIPELAIQPNEEQSCSKKLDELCVSKKSNDLIVKKSNHNSSLSIEIDLTQSDGDDSSSDRSPYKTSASPIETASYPDSLDKAIVNIDEKPDSRKSPSILSSLPSSLSSPTPPALTPQMDAASNQCLLSTINTFHSSSTIIPSEQSPCLEIVSPSTSDCLIDTSPVAHSLSNNSNGFICTTRVPVLPEFRHGSLGPSFECTPLASPSDAHQKNATNGSYSNVDRKRRLPCSITSIDASTIASVEKHNKLIKEHWYVSNVNHVSLRPAAPSQAMSSQGDLQNNQMAVVQPVAHQSVIKQNPCQTNRIRLPIIPKPINQREFAKKVESIGMYHKWKLPLPPYISLPCTEPAAPQSFRPSVILESPKQQQHVHQFSNIRTWIPLSGGLESHLSPAKQCPPPDVPQDPSPQLPKSSGPFDIVQPNQQQQSDFQHSGESFQIDTRPASKIHLNPAHQEFSKSHGAKKFLPNLIAISNEDATSQGVSPSLPAAPTVNEWTNNLLKNFKPILMLSRCEGGIRLEWTIPKLTVSQQVSQMESYVLYARKEKGLAPSLEASWLRVAVFSALPLPMSYIFKGLTPGHRYYFRIGATLRGRPGGARIQEISFTEPASIMI